MSTTNEPERPYPDFAKLRDDAREQQATRWYLLGCLYECAKGAARRTVPTEWMRVAVEIEYPDRDAWRSAMMYLVDAGWVVELYESLALTHQGVVAAEQVLRFGQLWPHFPADVVEQMEAENEASGDDQP